MNVLGGRVVFFGCVEGGDGCVEVFGVELVLRLKNEGGKIGWVEGEGFGAVGLGFLFVVHLGIKSACGNGRSGGR